jgi:3-hydroxy-9,10-secoandrosta-1,3,5(10)-triene-9,17-dione monooxygenase reductase component
MRGVFVPISTNKFKKTLGSFATGVTVVTTCLDSKLHGLTVNAFSSLSLNPPLVLICIDKKSESNKILKQSKIFAVNILSKDQKNLSKIFSDSKNKNRFHKVKTTTKITGSPIIVNSLGYIDCSVEKIIPAGDHNIFVGKIKSLNTKNLDPLIYYRGNYLV